jgi:bifunctional non-homologous end joining protein LigD
MLEIRSMSQKQYLPTRIGATKPPAPSSAHQTHRTPSRAPRGAGVNWDKRTPALRKRAGELVLFLDGHLVPLANLEKIWFPATGTTKRQVLSYYRKIAPVMLPHLRGRPLTLKRYPHGVADEHFYEKRSPTHKPEWVGTIPMRGIRFLEAATVADLLWIVNLASIEIHPYLMTKDALEKPRVVVFDLDPGEGAGLRECAKVALLVRETLAADGLESFPKTSGSKGIQVYAPLNPRAADAVTFDATKAYSRGVARALARARPDLVVHDMKKSLRGGKVLVDWSQNDRAKTTVAPYSMRGTASPGVSTPMRWEEVSRIVRARNVDRFAFGPKDVLNRVAAFGDLYHPVLTLRQRLPS